MSWQQYYWAYGSNMDVRQMARRCPGARPSSLATLMDYRLGFAGASRRWQGGAVATLLREPGASTSGLLYRIDDADLARLDRYEGHPGYYRRRSIRVVTQRGLTVRAQVYFLDAQPGFPSPLYYHRIAAAYVRLRLDPAALDAALERIL